MQAEQEAEARTADMAAYQRDHIDLDHLVRRLEAELEDLRQRRVEAYARWWNAREDRDRTLYVCRRLRRRLARIQRRNGRA